MEREMSVLPRPLENHVLVKRSRESKLHPVARRTGARSLELARPSGVGMGWQPKQGGLRKSARSVNISANPSGTAGFVDLGLPNLALPGSPGPAKLASFLVPLIQLFELRPDQIGVRLRAFPEPAKARCLDASRPNWSGA